MINENIQASKSLLAKTYGTNDLPYQSPKEISEDTVTLAESMKTKHNKIIVSSIVCCEESFKEKVEGVNAHLEEICAKKI